MKKQNQIKRGARFAIFYIMLSLVALTACDSLFDGKKSNDFETLPDGKIKLGNIDGLPSELQGATLEPVPDTSPAILKAEKNGKKFAFIKVDGEAGTEGKWETFLIDEHATDPMKAIQPAILEIGNDGHCTFQKETSFVTKVESKEEYTVSEKDGKVTFIPNTSGAHTGYVKMLYEMADASALQKILPTTEYQKDANGNLTMEVSTGNSITIFEKQSDGTYKVGSQILLLFPELAGIKLEMKDGKATFTIPKDIDISSVYQKILTMQSGY